MKSYPKHLIEGAIAGNKDDFAKLLESCMRDIVYFATLHSNRQDAEDIAQEVAIILQKKIHTLSDPDRFPKWLLVVTRNACVSYLRKGYKSKNDVEYEEYMAQEAVSVEGMEFLPETYVENKELCKIVIEEIDKLSRNQKICLSYYYLQEFKRADIVEATEFSPEQVTTALYDGKRTLKQRLEKRLGETLVFSVVPVGTVPAMARAFQELQMEVVPTEWCEQILRASLDKLGAMGTTPVNGMSNTVKFCVGAGICTVVTVGVISTVLFLGNDTPQSEVIPPLPIVDAGIDVDEEEYPEEPVLEEQEEPQQDTWVIRTVADMIGETEANVLEGFVDHVDSREAWQEFVERIGAEEHVRADEYQRTYVTYILEKQNKRLLLAEYDPGDGEIRVIYLFGDIDEPVERMAEIILRFR